MKFRTAVAAVAVALLASLLGPAAPAQAAKPRLSLLFTSANSGIVAGNALWAQTSIQWTGYVTGRPSGSRLVTQTKVAGAWRTIATTNKKVRKGVASGKYFPVLGLHRYRIALLSRTGKYLTASKAWSSTGYATVPISRVLTTLPPTIGAHSATVGGYAYPMLWRLDDVDTAPAVVANSWTIAENRCRSVRVVTSLSYFGAPGTSATAWFSVGWSTASNHYVAGDPKARVTASDSAASVVATVRSVGATSRTTGGYSLKPMAYSWTPGLFAPDRVPWTGGEAYFGGVALCSRLAR